MKIGLIPPKGYESYALLGTMQMVLAQELRRPEYLDTYAGKRLGLVVIDNGANENEPVSNDQLESSARLIDAHEIILPDVLRDAEGTKKKVWNYLLSSDPHHGYMGVVQGTTYDEVLEMVEWYSHLEHVTTLGIPRHLTETLGDVRTRLDLALDIQRYHPLRFDVHFLGSVIGFPGEAFKAANSLYNVRSLDTSAPFFYAMQDMWIGDAQDISRQEGYFTQEPSIDKALLHVNIRTMLEWANDR